MKAILHCDRKWGIGKGNALMFRLPGDMAFFRNATRGKVVVMGSNTLLSLPGSQPLKGRTNIVLWPGELPPDDVFVIGGAMMYRTLLPYCSSVLVTKVDADGGADTFFPDLDKEAGWSLASQSEPTEDNGLTERFCVYKNASPLPL